MDAAATLSAMATLGAGPLAERLDAVIAYHDGAIAEAKAAVIGRLALVDLVGLGLVAVLAVTLLHRPLRAARERTASLYAAQDELQDRVLHDPLTGLANRDFFEVQLEILAADPEREQEGIGVVQIELLRFRTVVGVLGQEAGDAVLRAVAERLREDAGPDDVIGRLDGERFGILIADVMDEDELGALASRLAALVAMPVVFEGRECRVLTRVGAAFTLDPPAEGPALLHRSNVALGRAHAELEPIVMYDPSLGEALSQRTEISAALRRALERDEVVPFFQPQVCIRTGQILGVEALVRWIDPEKGPRSPGLFLPIATETGLLTQIDDVMRRSALRHMREWRDRGLDVGHLGLNLTLTQLCEDGFLDRLQFDVDAVGLTPEDVAIEILESIIVEDGSDKVVEIVERLSRRGYYIELDDFGTGHSGLSTLRDLAVDRVKIDRSFVTDVHIRPDLAKFTRALIRLADNLGISILAEGIENEEERAWLQAEGCQVIQGYLI
ncbi:MAG: bifunctional diguanylate cyclase/phosphodiesterase, partial [Pseudomonadota bacterium]